MNEVATFFRHREDDPGETYHLRMDVPNGPFDYYVYSRRPLERRAVQDQQLGDREAHQQAVKDLRSVVHRAGGGLIVEAVDRNGGRTVGVIPVKSQGFQPPEDFVVLSPGRTSRWGRGEEGKRHDLAGGSHVMVPVDDDAKRHLDNFMQELEWLTPDLQSLVLQAIRRPSLDARLRKIENHLFGRPNDGAATAEAGGWMQWVRQWKPAAGVSDFTMAILLAVILVMIVFLIRSAGSSGPLVLQAVPEKTDAAKRTAPAPPPAASPDSEALKEDAYVDEARELLAALQSSADPAIAALKQKHFDDVPKGIPSAPQITALFREGSKKFLWGVIKLEAFDLYRRRFNADPADQTFLQDPKNVSVTKQTFREIWKDGFRASQAEQRLLLVLACRLGDPTAPQLPTEGKACKDLNAEDIAKGLPELTAFVKGRK